jgi:anti-anti-sigma regulatory factor
MMPEESEVWIYRDGSAVHARVKGPVNRETVASLHQRIHQALRGRCSVLTLDLGAADYVDSDGVRWLERLQVVLSRRHTDLRLAVREGSRADRTLRLLQLEKVFTVDQYPAESEAGVPAA